MKIVAIHNGVRPLSENNRAIIEAIRAIEDSLFFLKVTEYSGHARDLAFQAANSGCTVLIAIGGDGTIHEVVNGLKQSGKDIPLLLLPNGTANDLTRGLELNWTTEMVVNAIRKLHFKEIDLIRISQSDSIHWCVNIADTGFGGNVVQLLHRQRRFIGGGISYVIAIARSFFTFKKPQVIICSAEKNYAGPILLVAACNGPMFGDGLYIAPDALPNDGWMHVTLLGKVNFLDYLKNLARLKRKEKIKHPEAYYFRTKKVEVQTTNGKAYTEADGELIGEGKIVFEIQEAALKLIVPLN